MTARRANPFVRLFWVGALVLIAVTVGLMVARTGSEPASAAADGPPCENTELPPSGDRVTCSTGTTRLTIAGERRPLVLEGTHVRVLSSQLSGRTLTVTLRMRNESSVESRAPFGRGQLYVNVLGHKSEPAPLVGRARGEKRRAIRVRFRLGPRGAKHLADGKTRADLGVVPWSRLDQERPGALGVVRLEPEQR